MIILVGAQILNHYFVLISRELKTHRIFYLSQGLIEYLINKYFILSVKNSTKHFNSLFFKLAFCWLIAFGVLFKPGNASTTSMKPLVAILHSSGSGNLNFPGNCPTDAILRFGDNAVFKQPSFNTIYCTITTMSEYA